VVVGYAQSRVARDLKEVVIFLLHDLIRDRNFFESYFDLRFYVHVTLRASINLLREGMLRLA
jgi:hypothetical protein